MLDEIDKIGADFRGDPSSALLEVLDPEQNYSFRDHYLDVAFDLSKVMFIATANVTDTIHPAFLDRMEVIHLSGYTEEEKLEIARRHLIPRQIERERPHQPSCVDSPTPALDTLIRGYTREAGLRNLEREIGSVCRKVAVKVAEGDRRPRRGDAGDRWSGSSGRVQFLPEEQLKEDRVGVATGLAWTPVGGDVLHVEALALPGKGELKLTGHLGEVMKESAAAALSFARAHAADYGIAADLFDDPHPPRPRPGRRHAQGRALGRGHHAHRHRLGRAPDGAVRHDLAMTGEITLRGEVLPVGGVKEKVLAALRAGMRDILLPAENERDLADLPAEGPPAGADPFRPQRVRGAGGGAGSG